jgi:hypothetical protein
VFQLSLSSGTVPSQLKIAKVIPIFKSGDHSVLDNYRPILLLSNFSKILEKLVSNRLTKFIEENNLFNPAQYGFWKSRSTVHPLVHFMNTVSEALNKKHHVISIFCDLRKAFDTVDHSILFRKLKRLGLGDVEVDWFRSYLSNRKQFVYIDGKCSPLLDILLGVPQGSILGPLLFLIYINDLPLASALLSSLFADDTLLASSGPDIVELTNFVNREFYKVVQFFREHKLALHPSKTQFLIFTSSLAVRENPPSLYIKNNDIGDMQDPENIISIPNVNITSEVPAVKFLGVYLDPLLSFKFHIEKTANKLSSALFFLRKSKNFLTTKALKALYYSLFHSVWIYVWSSASLSVFNCLKVKQKAAIRIVRGASYNDHTEPILKQLNILPLDDLCNFFDLQFMQQFIQNFLPDSFNDMWALNVLRRNEDFHLHLRNDANYDVPFARTSMTERQPLTRIPKSWCDFSAEEIKIIRNKKAFNKDLKNHFLNKLKETVLCDRLFCTQCHPPDRL